MNWSFLLWFGVGTGIYLIGLIVWSLIKRHSMKKQIEIEDEVIDDEESKK